MKKPGGNFSPLTMGIAFMLAIVVVFSSVSPALAATFTITPSALGDWFFALETGTGGTGSLVYGPDTPPAGTGSARITLSSNTADGYILYNYGGTIMPAGTRLDTITTLSYSTYKTSGAAALAVALQLDVDYDITDASANWQGRLVYEPYYTHGNIPYNTWQEWNTLGAGRWWKTGLARVGNTVEPANLCPQSAPCTWTQILTYYPNAAIRTPAGLGFKAGSNWGAFDGNVDNLQVGISGNNNTYDFEHDPAPEIVTSGVGMLPVVGDGLIAPSETLTAGFNQITVTFDQDLYNPNDTDPDSVTNPDNYELLLNGVTPISIDSVSYSNGGGSGPYVATVDINGGANLGEGSYTFTVQGDTSVVNLSLVPIAGNGTTAGTDFVQNFTIALPVAATGSASTTALLPATGFAPGRVTYVPAQPESMRYAATDLTLEIPALGRNTTIVGVPKTEKGWDVTWLGSSVGYLEGSAFPTWAGNTVLTGHVWDAANQPGVFYGIKDLKYGDQIKIHAWGQVYTYEVRDNRLVTSRGTKAVFQSEELDWVTLVTCEYYNPLTGDYFFRRMVRAVLVSVE